MKIYRPEISRNYIFVLGLMCLAAALLFNQWLLTAIFSADGQLSPRSILLIWLFDGVMLLVGLVLALSRSLVTLLNVAVGLMLTVLLLVGLEKIVFYRLNHPPAPPSTEPAAPLPPAVHFEGSYTTGFFEDNELLGYTVTPNTTFESIKKLGDELVYSATYTIDAHSRRVTPGQDAAMRDQFLLYFGDSFTFGEGLNDTDTLPYYTAQLAPAYRVYNYGLSGYGPQQMLARLHRGSLPAEAPEANGIAIYVFIDAHVERAIGSMYVYNGWGNDMPYYTATLSGQLERHGSFRTGRPLISSLYEWLGQTEFARYYHLNLPGKLSAGHYWLTARLIAESRNEFMRQYPAGQFYVVIYPDEGDYFESIEPYFAEFDLKILNYDEWLKLDVALGTAFIGDGHPTGKANRQVAAWIVQDLGVGR